MAPQISDDTPEKMNTVLNVAANVARCYGGKGEEIEIRIVAFMPASTCFVPTARRAKLVPSGVVSLIELSERGWTVPRP